MKTISVTLPKSQAVVEIKEFLTVRDDRALKRVLMAGGSFNPNTQSMSEISGEVLFDAQDKTLELLVVSITTPDGTRMEETELIKKFIDNLPSTDGDFIFEEINKITDKSRLSEEGKKK